MVLIVRLLQREGSRQAGPLQPPARERVCMFQMVPWFLQLWLHTLQIAVDGRVGALHPRNKSLIKLFFLDDEL